ncbi:hypothetical protein TNCV_355381 [Trichonephila clavipes]|uniref:Uncharacterized protein n=1 Tax=Trichonephila clavipes TaxID=2585209 RepID=A0A8X7BDA0_TRICX|nr:hypothetical protein TNCV_355381 [Trichonephila clavipes]
MPEESSLFIYVYGQEGCGSSVMPVESNVLDKTIMIWLFVFWPHRQRCLRLLRDAGCWFSGHTAKEVCGSSVMLAFGFPAVPYLQRNLLNC